MTPENGTFEEPPRSRTRIVIVVLAIAVAGLILIPRFIRQSDASRADISAAGTTESALVSSDTATPGSEESGPFMDKLGIKVTGANLSVGGTRLDVRYRVADSRRAILLTNDNYRAYVVNASGKPLRLPTGPSAAPIQNQSGQMPRQGYVYSHFFPNPNHAVKSGEQITLVIGDMRENVVVQ